MKIQITLFLALLLCYGISLAGEVESEIKSVTIYQMGAKITHEADVSVPAGTSEIVLSELTSSLQINSLQVNIKGTAILLSATSRIDYLSRKEISKSISILNDSVQLLDKQIRFLDGEKIVLSGEEQLINQNNKLGSQQESMNVEELKQLALFYRTRLNEIKKRYIEIELEETRLINKKTNIQYQLNGYNVQINRPVGQVVLSVSADNACKVKILFSYYTQSASWQPIYDIRSNGTDKPTELLYKANIAQNTGYDWKNVKLIVSTGNPAIDNNRPILYPWYINFYVAPVYQQQYGLAKRSAPQMMQGAAMNIAQDYSEEAIAYEDISTMAPAYEVNVSTSQVNEEYNIDIPQDIPCDNKTHTVAMKVYSLNAEYTYHAVPKLNDGAFLLAKINEYGQYNLLPGTANLFNEGMYVGQSYIDPVSTGDTLLISLGRDTKINIKRNQLKDFTSKQVIGNNFKVTKGYEMIVRNNKSYEIDLEVLDQIPVSQNKEIEVTLDDAGGCEYSKDYGKLLWRMKLKPGETKKVKFVFTVKYPKDQRIDML